MSWQSWLETGAVRAEPGEIQTGVDQATAGDLLDGPDAMEQLRQALNRKTE